MKDKAAFLKHLACVRLWARTLESKCAHTQVFCPKHVLEAVQSLFQNHDWPMGTDHDLF